MNGALRVVLCSLVAMLAAIPSAPAQEWPARPVTLVNLFGAGGVDFATRALAKALTERLGQPFVVETRAGAGGSVGSAYVARSTPDGYTLLMTAIGPAVLISCCSSRFPTTRIPISLP